MKKSILSALLLAAVILPASAGVKIIGEVNGLKIVRIKTCGVFTPSTTTLAVFDPNQPGTLSVLNSAAGPGLIPAAANAGGLVGAAALLRPDRSETNVNASGGSSGASSAATGSGVATSGGGPFVPPGHLNNPSGNH